MMHLQYLHYQTHLSTVTLSCIYLKKHEAKTNSSMYTNHCTCKRMSVWFSWNFSTASVDPRYFLRASCLSIMFPGPKEIVPSACKGRASARGGAGVTLGSRYRKTKWLPSPMRSPGLRTASLYSTTPLWLTAPPLNGRSRAVGTIASSFMDHEFKLICRLKNLKEPRSY